MRRSISHRSLSQSRNQSQPNLSFGDLDEWNGAGLVNNRMTQAQQIKAQSHVLKKFMGDRILEQKRRQLSEHGFSLPKIDNSYRSPVSVSLLSNNILLQKNHLAPSPRSSSRNQEIKNEKIQMLILLNQLGKEYKEETKPSASSYDLVEEILEILQKQENIYGQDMQLLFKVIKEMIFCCQKELIDFVLSFSTEKHKFCDKYTSKPYFELLDTLKKEMESIYLKNEQLNKASSTEIAGLKGKVQKLETDMDRMIFKNIAELSKIKSSHAEEITKKTQKIEIMQSELSRLTRDNSMMSQMMEKNQMKIDTMTNKYNREVLVSTDFKEKLEALKQEFENISQDYEKKAKDIEYLEIQNNALQDQMGDMTPRPFFDYNNILIPMGIEEDMFNESSTMQKVDLLKEKMTEKLSELAQYSSPKRSLKSKQSVVFSDATLLHLKPVKSNSPSPSKRGSQETKVKFDVAPNSPLKKPVPLLRRESTQPKQLEGIIRRKSQKSVTQVRGDSSSPTKISEQSQDSIKDGGDQPQQQQQQQSFKKQIRSQLLASQESERSKKSEGNESNNGNSNNNSNNTNNAPKEFTFSDNKLEENNDSQSSIAD